MIKLQGKTVDLKPDRTLLDPYFDGYKLYLQTLPIHSIQLIDGIDAVTLSEDEYSYQHVKAFGVHNTLHIDPWNDQLVYFVDTKWRVMLVVGNLDRPLEKPICVFTLPNATNQRLSPGRRHVTLSFPSKNHALLSDGAGVLYLLCTDDRVGADTWQVQYTSTPNGNDCGEYFTILDSRLYESHEKLCCQCILLSVELNSNKAAAQKNPFRTVLTWLDLTSDDKCRWHLHRRRQLSGTSVPDLLTLQSAGQGLYIASEKAFRLSFDSEQPELDVLETNEIQEEKLDYQDPPEVTYNWSQTENDVTAVFVLPEGTTSGDVIYNLTSKQVELRINEQGDLLRGELFSQVVASDSTWTLNDNRLELYLSKQGVEVWPELVLGDRSGRLMLDTEQLAKLDDIASSLRTEASTEGAPYNAQELEEVDAYPDDTAMLMLFSSQTNDVTHKAFLSSHQWLFNVRISPDTPKAICLRHDVDGILWQPDDAADSDHPWKHLATFNAFGYVQASKRDRKFSSCAPNFAYSVICDCVRHVYIYRQNSPTATPLRNRKTGENVRSIAKQQLVSLESTDTIMGMQVTNDLLYLLTEKSLYIVRIDVTEMV